MKRLSALFTTFALVVLSSSMSAASRSGREPAPARSLRWVQEVLALRSYYIGPIDGRQGPMTRSALVQFQFDHHDRLRPTGALDRATLDLLEDLARSGSTEGGA